LAGPFLDRFDLRISIGAPDPEALLGPPGEPSVSIRRRVGAAREAQSARGVINGHMRRVHLDGEELDAQSRWLLRRAVEGGILTGRGADRVRRVARTIADLAGVEHVAEEHVAEALAYRSGL
jgi:magnesium chelatase family protein